MPLDLLVNALILIVIAVVMAAARPHTEEVAHLVLIKRERAGVAIGVFIVLIEFAAIAARLMLYSVLRKIHIT